MAPNRHIDVPTSLADAMKSLTTNTPEPTNAVHPCNLPTLDVHVSPDIQAMSSTALDSGLSFLSEHLGNDGSSLAKFPALPQFLNMENSFTGASYHGVMSRTWNSYQVPYGPDGSGSHGEIVVPEFNLDQLDYTLPQSQPIGSPIHDDGNDSDGTSGSGSLLFEQETRQSPTWSSSSSFVNPFSVDDCSLGNSSAQQSGRDIRQMEYETMEVLRQLNGTYCFLQLVSSNSLQTKIQTIASIQAFRAMRLALLWTYFMETWL
ncbi:hypothetical protein RhiJN_23514 [Ceratobasidium sp. AG-Ba]|nr:hypothetical protein RhiJN_23514 [Ceratobasidium sp. AG-Ba]